MRLISFLKDGRWWPAVQRGDRIAEISGPASASPHDILKAVLEGQPFNKGAAHDIAEVTLGLPIPHPRQDRLSRLELCRSRQGRRQSDSGLSRGVPARDQFIDRARPAAVAARVLGQVRLRGRTAVVIGKPARHVTEANALSHVFGYACFNDGSVRDYQRKSTQWTIGKNFDGTGAFGPCVVSADELPAGAAGLRIACRYNGETMQDGNTSDMIFPIARTIAILSEAITLEPGEVEIEGIGTLRNPVVDA